MKDDFKLQWDEMKCNVAVSSVHTVCVVAMLVYMQKLYTNMAAAYISLSNDRTNKKPWTWNAQYYFSESWPNTPFLTYLWVEEVKSSIDYKKR